MLEPPIPSFKTLSSPEYCNAFHLGSLNSFVPQEPKSDHVAPLLFMIRKCCKCLSKTYKTLHDRTAVSLTPPTTAPLSLSWLHRTSFPQTLQAHLHLRAFALAVPSAYSALPPHFPMAGSFLSFIPSVIFSERLPQWHHPKKSPTRPLSFTSLLYFLLSTYH